MQVVGLAGFLSSNTTRELKLSCGISLTFRKLQLQHYADNEDQIVRRRGSISSTINQIVESLKEVNDKEVREATLKGVTEAVKELSLRPSIAFFDEMLDWSMSPQGKAYELYLATKDHSEHIKDPGDAYALLESTLSQAERDEIETHLAWAGELQLIKNSDSPSADPESLAGMENLLDGDSSSESLVSDTPSSK